MTIQETVKLFQEHLNYRYTQAGKEEYTAQVFIDASKDTGDVSAIIDMIFILAETHGIKKAELHPIAEQDQAYQNHKQAHQQKQAQKDLLTALKTSCAELVNNFDALDDSNRNQALKQLSENATAIVSAGQKEKIPPRKKSLTADDYLADCKAYDPAKDFKPSMCAGLRFPAGTLSYIGGRPGAGKSALLINIAREALDAGRNVFLVNLEMLNKSIATNFLLSCMYAEAGMNARRELNAVDNPAGQHYGLFKDGYTAPKTFVKCRKNALAKYTALFDNRFVIYDGTSSPLPEIIAEIKSRVQAEDVVLIDYVQRLRPPSNMDRDARYLHIKHISNDLLGLAINQQVAVIAGAQLGRSVKNDEATLADFREGGDIEQDAHNALAVETVNETDRYVHVLKAREGGAEFRRQKLDCVFPYLYIAGTGEEYTPAEKENPNPDPPKKVGSKAGKIIGRD